MNKTNLASEMRTAFENAGKLTGMDTAAKDALEADWELFMGVVLDHIKTNMVVKTTLDTSLNSIFSSGTPVPNDGGAALKTAWTSSTAAGAKDDATSNSVE